MCSCKGSRGRWTKLTGGGALWHKQIYKIRETTNTAPLGIHRRSVRTRGMGGMGPWSPEGMGNAGFEGGEGDTKRRVMDMAPWLPCRVCTNWYRKD